MSFHTLAYLSSVPNGNSPGAVTPVTDNVYATANYQGGAGLLLPGSMRVIAAWAGSLNLVRSRILAPSFLALGYPTIRPATQGTTPGSDPNFDVLFDRPITLKNNEILGIDAVHSGGAPQNVAALAWVADVLEPAPAGAAFWIRYTASQAVTAGSWTQVPLNFEYSLPDGIYAVTGMEHWSTTCIAARLVFPGAEQRPGVLGLSGGTGPAPYRTHAVFYEGGLGVFGRFYSFARPAVEVLATAADATHEGYLRLVPLPRS